MRLRGPVLLLELGVRRGSSRCAQGGSPGSGRGRSLALAGRPGLMGFLRDISSSSASCAAELSRPTFCASATRSARASSSSCSRAASERRQRRAAGSSPSILVAAWASRALRSRSSSCSMKAERGPMSGGAPSAASSRPMASACSSQSSRPNRSWPWTACRRQASTVCASSWTQRPCTSAASGSRSSASRSPAARSGRRAARSASPPSAAAAASCRRLWSAASAGCPRPLVFAQVLTSRCATSTTTSRCNTWHQASCHRAA
mmetsp:Transcript_10321/g.30291  ORF Transcript_10321/g.30291 Transcript_10321/m.30291 type:complete len:261 (-) Transcript_10321:275-1057(-)